MIFKRVIGSNRKKKKDHTLEKKTADFILIGSKANIEISVTLFAGKIM